MQTFLTGSKDKSLERILFKWKTLTYSLGGLYFLGLEPIPGHTRPNTDSLGKGEADWQ